MPWNDQAREPPLRSADGKGRRPGADRVWPAVTVGLLLLPFLALVPSTQGQIHSCGDGFDLFIRNPDVEPRQDGRFYSSGDFFFQFQVIGPRADEVEQVALTIGPPPMLPEDICALPVWPSAGVEGFKADFDESDGFFLYLHTNTQATPQNADIQTTVHAYDAEGRELVRFWAITQVESCPGAVGGCTADVKDRIAPWPIILPGDGDVALVEGFTVEFAEPLASFRAFVNGVEVTAEMAEWEGRLWDRDGYPDRGPQGVTGQLTPSCTQPGQSCLRSPGPAYQWTGRAITDADVLRVEATDLAGNRARKAIHVGSSVAGGTIADDLPIFTATVDDTTATARPGDTAVFRMRIENSGGGEGHPIVAADVPPGWTYEWVPGHRPVPAASTSLQELNIRVPANTTAGLFPANATLYYQQGADDHDLVTPLTIQVIDAPAPAEQPVLDAPGKVAKDSPGLGLLLAPALALAAALRSRRSRPSRPA